MGLNGNGIRIRQTPTLHKMLFLLIGNARRFCDLVGPLLIVIDTYMRSALRFSSSAIAVSILDN